MTYDAQQANPKDLEIISGNLRDVIQQSKPYSRQTGAEISLARTQYEENPELASQLARTFFYVANVHLFMRQGKRLLCGIGGRAAFNTVYGKDTENATKELAETGFYRLPTDKRDAINLLLGSGEVTFVDFNDVKLKIDNSDYGHFAIRTGKYRKDVTPSRAPFVRAGFGEGIVLEKVMGYLADNSVRKIDETNVYLSNPEPVAEALKELKDGEIVARACRLDDFDNFSNFIAIDWGVGNSDALRGVRENVAKGDGKKSGGNIETLIGKGTDVGNGLVVIRREQITPEEYALLTGK